MMPVASKIRVVLIANYLPDRQTSMQRFAEMLHAELVAASVDVQVWRPPTVVCRGRETEHGLGKWLGYVDKFALFPSRLHRMLPRDRNTIVHVCDHSNAVYVPWLRDVPHVVTCHDLLAVRAARGEFRQTRTRLSGKCLQRLVCRGLRQAAHIVCDSDATRADLGRLCPGHADSPVIAPGVSAAFQPMSRDDALNRAAGLLPSNVLRDGFILHVGGSQWYKNRAGLIDMYAALVGRRGDVPPLVVVGRPPSRSLRDRITARSLNHRIIAVGSVGDAELAAFYRCASMLLFPSLAEGFGWPVVEALACDCRVVASDRAPITDVAGPAATYFDPTDPVAGAAVIDQVLSETDEARQVHVAAGRLRAKRYTSRAMAQSYLSLYASVLDRRLHAA